VEGTSAARALLGGSSWAVMVAVVMLPATDVVLVEALVLVAPAWGAVIVVLLLAGRG
jgi:hypothetical protein